jgi:hypothetical protein
MLDARVCWSAAVLLRLLLLREVRPCARRTCGGRGERGTTVQQQQGPVNEQEKTDNAQGDHSLCGCDTEYARDPCLLSLLLSEPSPVLPPLSVPASFPLPASQPPMAERWRQ